MKWIWLSALVLIIDQITKHQASHHLLLHQPVPIMDSFNLTLMHNTGAAFSLLSQAGGWQRWFFIALAGIIGGVIIIWMYNLPRQKHWLAVALALTLGGVSGNLWDRVALGYVVDFIEIYYQSWYWPVFNIADAAITAGAIMLIIDALWLDKPGVDK